MYQGQAAKRITDFMVETAAKGRANG
jgi:hypothetical protein